MEFVLRCLKYGEVFESAIIREGNKKLEDPEGGAAIK